MNLKDKITSITYDITTNKVIANLSHKIDYNGYMTDKIIIATGFDKFIEISNKFIKSKN